MSKPANSVIGIDLGKQSFKAVLLHRKGDQRFVLTSFASRPVSVPNATADELSQEIKSLLKDLGGSAKACAVALSDPDSLLRIVEQPSTPVELLRSALRLNGLAVLNQECKDFVLDCAPVSAVAMAHAGGDGGVAEQGSKTRYLVGGLLRPTVQQIVDAFAKTKLAPAVLQLPAVCSFNAFEFAYPQVFANDAFFLLDLGHEQSTVLIGRRGELLLARSIDYGGKQVAESLAALGAVDAASSRAMMEQGDPGMADICHQSLLRLAVEVRNSIGFFEGQSEESIQRIFVSGGLAKVGMVLQSMSDELGLPCEVWDPLETCEVALPAAKRQALPHEFVTLNVACGAALSYFNAP